MSTNGGEISVKFSSQEESRLWQNFTRLIVEGRKVALGLQDANESAVKFEKGLDKFADQIKRVDAGPIGALREEMRKLDAAVAAGLLKEEQASAGRIEAQRRYQAEIRKTREERQRMGVVDPLDVSGDPATSTADKIEAGPLREYQAAMERLRATREKLAMDDATYAAASQAHYAEYIRQAKEIEAADLRVATTRKAASDAKSARDMERASEQAAREAAAAQEKLTRAAEKAKAALDAERDSFARQAEQIRRIDATPIERLKLRLDELRDAQKRVGMSQQDFETLSKKAHDQYQLEVRQSVAETERLKREAEDTGSSWSETAASVRAGWLVVAAGVTKTLYDIQQASQQAQEAMKAAAPSRGTLAQLALTSPEKYAELTKQAEQIRASGAAATLEEANRFVFSMESAGAGAEIPLFAEAKRLGLMADPSSMIASAAGIRESFGAERAGSFQDLINRSLVASASSPAKAEELLRGAGKAGVAARQQGIQVDELLAATSILATAKGSADEGGSRLNALLSALSVTEPTKDAKGRIRRDSPLQASLRGRSLADIAGDETLGAMTPAQLQKALGSREAVEAFGVLREQAAKLKQLTGEIAGGVREDRLTQGLNILRGDRAIAAPVQAQAAAGALEVARQQAAPTGLEIEALIARNQRRMEIETPARVQELTRAAEQARQLGMVGEADVMAAEIQRRPGQLARFNATVEAGGLRAGGFFAGAVGAEERFLKFLQDADQREQEARKASNEAMERVRRAAEAMEKAADKLDTRGIQVRRELGAARREAAVAAGN